MTQSEELTRVLERLSTELAEAVKLTTKTDEEKLKEAADNALIATFEYRKPDEDDFEVRVVRVEDFAEAISTAYKFHFIRAFDFVRGDYRSFRLERMKNATVKVAE